MKKITAIFGVITLVFMLAGCGYSNDYPRIRIDPNPSENYIDIELGNESTYDRFERFDTEDEIKIVLYFNKNQQ